MGVIHGLQEINYVKVLNKMIYIIITNGVSICSQLLCVVLGSIKRVKTCANGMHRNRAATVPDFQVSCQFGD